MKSSANEQTTLSIAAVVIATIMVAGVLYFMRPVVLPIILAMFFASLARPLQLRLQRFLPSSLALVVTVLLVGAMLVALPLVFAALNAGGAGLFTWALGIDFPALWTLLTFILYFIPNFGTLIATVPPILLALVQFESPTTAIVCLIGLVVIFNLLGNVLEPRFLGRTLSLSPLVVFISLLFWGWYFGMVGVILSVPLTVAIGIICDHIDSLRPMAALLADRPRPVEAPKAPIGERTR